MLRWIVRWMLLACALLLLSRLHAGMAVSGFGAALAASLVIGLLNALVRPVLVVLTLPVTLLTLGLFLFVVNALMFWAAAWLLDGLSTRGFGGALVASLAYGACAVVIDAAVERLFARSDDASA